MTDKGAGAQGPGVLCSDPARLKAERAADAAPAVSPLAPKGGFPALPRIAGIRLAAGTAGVRYRDRPDVMLAEVAPGSAIAGVFTRSATRAAPVRDCQIKLPCLQAGLTTRPVGIVINSGNANAFTGPAGTGSVCRVCAAAAAALGTSAGHILTASTGVIGELLPDGRITAILGPLAAALSDAGARAAAQAIMTTDTFPKGAAARAEVGGRTVSLAGIAKGSGMIAPDMATMLACIFTDCAVAPGVLQTMVSGLNAQTFNAITVDSDTSTSDSLLVCATGQAGNRLLGDATGAPAAAFSRALRTVMADLAGQVVRDGEGATKFIRISVQGAADDGSAASVGRAIANSPLVKTAVAGEDPNWGRIVMAIGKSGEPVDCDRIAIWFGEVLVAECGRVAPGYTEAAGAAHLKGTEIGITVDLGVGAGAATVRTCDLTGRYVAINAGYRS
ncbi:MAG: bifunctional glutamate N-acetyltransferase/amino-acid acetyltransferase ArgJ [Rhodobacteraceae bacterium]|nr:bifunctional glutamate N-acetyltransferase/amino-acid acetyltransferase ArgJ [Paracoccaceae bacterium]